jgi:CRISPR/Cas system-associated exonuclease Cas4 (RecB family)
MPNKFIKKDTKLLEATQEAIKNEIKRRNYKLIHEVFNIKHLTECPRRIYYRAHGIKTETQQDFLANIHLEYTKKKWIDLFNQSTKIKILDRDILAADTNYNIVANVDAVLKYGEFVSTLTVDVLNSNQYTIANQSGGLRRQIVEVMTATWLTEVPNGILLCENKETNEYFLSHIIVHKPIIEGVKSKCKHLIEKKFLQQLPDRPYTNNSFQECIACEYRKTCWEKEIKSNGKS